MTYALSDPLDLAAEVWSMAVPALGVTVHLERTYPFSSPIVAVNGVPSFKVFTLQHREIKPLCEAYDLHIPCVCCTPVQCSWSPCYGISNALDEYVGMATCLNQLVGYKAILNRLPFDDGIHSHILHFL